jgi:tetratricopeptide (TPR) repeat protein
LLETIRQYAREKLAEAEDSARLRDRHLDYFLELAEQSERKLRGREQKKWLSRLEKEYDNLRVALEWSLQSRPALGLRMAAALWEFWDTHGHLTEARQWLDRLLNATQSLPPDSTRVRALIASMAFASRQTDLEGWLSPLDQALAISRELNDIWGIAQCLIAQGLYKEYIEGNIKDAEPLYGEALNLARQLDDKLFIGQALGPMASCALKRYDHEHAADIYGESLILFREVGNEREIAGAFENLAEVAFFRRDYESVRNFAQESLALYRDLEDKHGIATALRTLCDVLNNQGKVSDAQFAGEQSVSLFRDLSDRGCMGLALAILARSVQAQGDLQSATSLAQEAATVLHEAGERIPEVMTMDVLGRIALEQGAPSSAREHFRHGLDLLKEIQDITQLPSLLEGLGATLAILSQSHDAIRLLGAADALREKTRLSILEIERSDYDRTLSLLHSQVDESSFQKIWKDGYVFTTEQVITFVLGGTS